MSIEAAAEELFKRINQKYGSTTMPWPFCPEHDWCVETATKMMQAAVVSPAGGFTTNIQWKGTDVCMDFNCPKCGEFAHFDGFFAYAIQCPSCEAYFQMPTDVPIVELSERPDMPILFAEDEDNE